LSNGNPSTVNSNTGKSRNLHSSSINSNTTLIAENLSTENLNVPNSSKGDLSATNSSIGNLSDTNSSNANLSVGNPSIGNLSDTNSSNANSSVDNPSSMENVGDNYSSPSLFNKQSGMGLLYREADKNETPIGATMQDTFLGGLEGTENAASNRIVSKSKAQEAKEAAKVLMAITLPLFLLFVGYLVVKKRI
jgi:hypothetical protein